MAPNQKKEARPQVYGAHRFMVELDGMLVGGFSEVSGLSVQTELEDYPEGGLNHYVHRLPKQTRLEPLTLKRGVTVSNELWDWYADVIEGTIVRKSGSVIMYNEQYAELRRWNFYDAYPCKWLGPAWNAADSSIAVETIELVHNGLKAV
jgi:phage tail-like protein